MQIFPAIAALRVPLLPETLNETSRRILGTVTNAIYVKPQTSYWFDLGRSRAIGLNASVVLSMAQVPVSTPGNSLLPSLSSSKGPMCGGGKIGRTGLGSPSSAAVML